LLLPPPDLQTDIWNHLFGIPHLLAFSGPMIVVSNFISTHANWSTAFGFIFIPLWSRSAAATASLCPAFPHVVESWSWAVLLGSLKPKLHSLQYPFYRAGYWIAYFVITRSTGDAGKGLRDFFRDRTCGEVPEFAGSFGRHSSRMGTRH
jgi:hypothetical protein